VTETTLEHVWAMGRDLPIPEDARVGDSWTYPSSMRQLPGPESELAVVSEVPLSRAIARAANPDTVLLLSVVGRWPVRVLDPTAVPALVDALDDATDVRAWRLDGPGGRSRPQRPWVLLFESGHC
jgi:hypothetical protein